MKGMILSVLAGLVMVAAAQMSTASPTPVLHCFRCKWTMGPGGVICRECLHSSPGYFNCSCDLFGCCVSPYTCTESNPGCSG